MMTKTEFLNEVNRTLKDAMITDDQLKYEYTDRSAMSRQGSDLLINFSRGEARIEYKGKKRVYETGHGTTFPSKFIEDILDGYYKS